MPASNDTALAFAGHLRSLSDDDLVRLLSARELRENGIKDFFDLADALLDPASVQQALAHLDRPTLAALWTVGDLGTASIPDATASLKAAGAEEPNEVVVAERPQVPCEGQGGVVTCGHPLLHDPDECC